MTHRLTKRVERIEEQRTNGVQIIALPKGMERHHEGVANLVEGQRDRRFQNYALMTNEDLRL